MGLDRATCRQAHTHIYIYMHTQIHSPPADTHIHTLSHKTPPPGNSNYRVQGWFPEPPANLSAFLL